MFLRRRTPTMGTISYILWDDSWGNGYAAQAAHPVVTAAFTTAGLSQSTPAALMARSTSAKGPFAVLHRHYALNSEGDEIFATAVDGR
ncbi:hypothetical protein ACPCDX_30515 [Streptomyces koyangensis]|uniref:hypothetical protein n=1 Tax=Streptomyces koyangensis TaxID=188770 RepID=UPI003C2ACA10